MGQTSSMKGRKHTEESRRKMSEAQKKLWENPEHRRKRKEMATNLWKEPEYRKKFEEGMQKHYGKEKTINLKKPA